LNVVYEKIDYGTMPLLLSIIITVFFKYQNNINNFVRNIIRHIAYIKLQDKIRADRFIILVIILILDD